MKEKIAHHISYDPPDPWAQFFAEFMDLSALTEKQLEIARTQLAREAGLDPDADEAQ